MITFFATEGPEATCNSLDSKLNEAAIFHEALHAKSGLQDTYFPPPDLLSVFKFNDLQDPSVKITYGIIDNVLGGGVGDHVCGN
jgi:hypothetical protein